jgi:hypothetical protein
VAARQQRRLAKVRGPALERLRPQPEMAKPSAQVPRPAAKRPARAMRPALEQRPTEPQRAAKKMICHRTAGRLRQK